MNCPNCAQSMTVHAVGGRLETSVEIDACEACQAFWFDSLESPRLSPASTLRLFSFIADSLPRRSGSIGQVLKCPRCSAQLLETHDMQRNTRFSYSRCPHGHGRFTTFFNFLREKDFLRPLAAPQIDELRRHVQTVNCSNCGAPVDLARGSACGHCRSPLSILDLQQAERLVEQLRQATEPKAIDPRLPVELARVRREIDAVFAGSRDKISWWGDTSTIGLLGAAITAVARLLRR